MTNQRRRPKKLNISRASRKQKKDPHHWHHKVRGLCPQLCQATATAVADSISSAVGVQLRYEPQILVEKEVVECTLLMLLGVQSWLFTWDDVKEVPGFKREEVRAFQITHLWFGCKPTGRRRTESCPPAFALLPWRRPA